MIHSQHELEFNRVLKSDRHIVKKAFGILKMKWWRLKYVDVFKIKNVHTVTLVAASLHNFVLTHVADWDDVVNGDVDEEEDNNTYQFDIDEKEQMGF